MMASCRCGCLARFVLTQEASHEHSRPSSVRKAACLAPAALTCTTSAPLSCPLKGPGEECCNDSSRDWPDCSRQQEEESIAFHGMCGVLLFGLPAPEMSVLPSNRPMLCYASRCAHSPARPPARPPASTLTHPPTWECGIATPSGSGGGSSPSIIARRARYMSCAQWHGVGSRQHGQGRDQGQQGSRAIQAQSNGAPTHVLTVHSVPTPPRPQPHPLHTCPPACLRRRSGSLLAHSSGAAPERSGAP